MKSLIYPVPDPKFPFLGVHLTRMIDGMVEAGPNAVLALAREGYKKSHVRLADIGEMLRFKGFWKMTGKYWKIGLYEQYRSFSKKAFVKSLQRLVPTISEDDLIPGGAGIRAQAVSQNGALVDDFAFAEEKGALHVINAPSPAATSSLAIGKSIATKVVAAG